MLSSFISQLVRYANINLHIDSFKLDVMVMVDKLITPNYHRKKLGKIFIHFGKMYSHLWVKFGHDILHRDFIKHIFRVSTTDFVLT